MDDRSGRPTIAVGIATSGRPDILGVTVELISRQSRRPDAVFVCPATDADLPDACRSDPAVTIVRSALGSCRQRNAILDRCEGFDCLVFLDDDFLPAADFLREAESAFRRHPSVVAMSGRVIADGVTGPGIAVDEAVRLLSAIPRGGEAAIREIHNAYGCNMAVRLAPVTASRLRFDEALPLYGWLEDVDFCRRLARFGTIARCDAMVGVHLGVKAGRTSGVRFGYSQIANPVYLYRKGTLALPRAVAQMTRNVLRNAVRSLRPEPWCDRRGRLRGNALAMTDLIRARSDPRRILDL